MTARLYPKEPPLWPSPPYLSVDYRTAPIEPGRMRVTRVIHFIDRYGQKDTDVVDWTEDTLAEPRNF